MVDLGMYIFNVRNPTVVFTGSAVCVTYAYGRSS